LKKGEEKEVSDIFEERKKEGRSGVWFPRCVVSQREEEEEGRGGARGRRDGEAMNRTRSGSKDEEGGLRTFFSPHVADDEEKGG